MACNLSFVKSEGVLKVTSSHVHFKSGSISKIVLDGDIMAKISPIAMTLGVFQSHSSIAFFQMEYSIVARHLLTSASRGLSAIAELLVYFDDVLRCTIRRSQRGE